MFSQTIKNTFIYRAISITKKSLQVFFVGLLLQFGLSSVLHAETGNFTQYDATGTPLAGTNQFKVAIRAPLTHCGVEETLPYVVIFLGTPGHFIGRDGDQTNYYTGPAEKIASKLESKCVRTVIIETTTPYRQYTGNSDSALERGSVGIGAAYIYDILVSLQAHNHFKNASKWYLMGGSAGSLMSVKLVDNQFKSPGRNTILDLPAGVILESLPSSGSVVMDCENTNPLSSYESSVIGRGYSCSNVKNDPDSYRSSRYEFLDGVGIKTYMNQGKKILIMQGANDPLFKESLTVMQTKPEKNKYVSNRFGWTMIGLLKNFVTKTQLASTCSRIDGTDSTSDDLTISNTQKTWSCYSGRFFARTYANSGHSPTKYNPQAIDDLAKIIETTD